MVFIFTLGSIPVGIAVARQRVGDAGLLAALSQKDNQQRMHDIGKLFCMYTAEKNCFKFADNIVAIVFPSYHTKICIHR